jgi:hypothetical protein
MIDVAIDLGCAPQIILAGRAVCLPFSSLVFVSAPDYA